jgi:glyoxylase-like metal-dependent hydrolase (beta-lactamase superfamily II)
MLADGVSWFDDWYAIETIAPGIHAIGEPKYHQCNWSYLIEGSERALLFDTGPGLRDISIVTARLTGKPVIALPSHMHFDHVGNLGRFEDLAFADLPLLRGLEGDGLIGDPGDHYLGEEENLVWMPVRVRRWIRPGSSIDLGGRAPQLLHTPGHSPDSVSLLLGQESFLFAADFVYPGKLYAQVPHADLAAYLDVAGQLLASLAENASILCAHGMPDGTGLHRAPRLQRADIADLASALSALRTTGQVHEAWPVNERMSLLVSPAAFRTWQMG